jgi:hypothetical protein
MSRYDDRKHLSTETDFESPAFNRACDREIKRREIEKHPARQHCWLGFSDRRECPNMCAGRLCGYARS